MEFRPNVALVLANSEGKVLVCERSDWRGSWQFPQGGVQDGETMEEALEREVWEETGLEPSDYEVVARAGPFRYMFPGKMRRGRFDGQEQTYFLARLREGARSPDFGDGSGEFVGGRWVEPSQFDFDEAPPMKREIYRQVLAEFFPRQCREARHHQAA